MSNYLLLNNSKVCPVCRCKGRVNHFTNCPNCGTMLFLRAICFKQWEADGGIPNWWIFHKTNGWMHRDHVVSREAVEALTRTTYQPKPVERNTKSVLNHAI